jgi:CheY-like chemotaxis protein
MNLVINGSEAIGDRSGVIAISTGTMDCDRSYLQGTALDENLAEGLYAYFEVADTGCGMDAETLQRLYEPFFSTKFAGRGLGMAATLGIVRGHKGAIKVYSEPGKGTTFKVLLPASGRPETLYDTSKTDSSWKGSGTVLLVDDEETIRTIGKDMLQELGFEVLMATDGHEALKLFQERRENIFCVLMDLTMPHMDGEEAFRELRRIDPAIPIIMSSGYNEQEVSQKFLGKGLSGFLQKPYRVSKLADTLRSLANNPPH